MLTNSQFYYYFAVNLLFASLNIKEYSGSFNTEVCIAICLFIAVYFQLNS